MKKGKRDEDEFYRASRDQLSWNFFCPEESSISIKVNCRRFRIEDSNVVHTGKEQEFSRFERGNHSQKQREKMLWSKRGDDRNNERRCQT